MTRRTLLALFAAALLPAQYHTLSRDRLIELTAANPYPRFDDGRPKIPDSVLDQARGLSVEEIWGVIRAQFPNQFEGNWQVMHPGTKMIGRAVTAQFMPLRPDLNDLVIGALKQRGYQSAAHQWVIDQLQPGDVLVADLFGKNEGGSIVGDNLAMAIRSATNNGGLVVDGAIRDLEGIHPMGMPIYYRHATPSAIAQVTLTGYNIPTRIGQATVIPGDLVFGDRTGIYFVPPALIQKVLDRAVETHIHDEWTKDKFSKSRYKSSDLYPRPKDPALQKEYDEYKKQRLEKKQ